MELTVAEQCAIGTSFKTALLLTASAELAQLIVLEAIRQQDGDEISGEELRRTCMILASMARPAVAQQPDQASNLLPPELRRVVHLEDNLRRSFVLRTLAGLSARQCAGLLKLTPQDVNRRACAAAIQLADVPNSALVNYDRDARFDS